MTSAVRDPPRWRCRRDRPPFHRRRPGGGIIASLDVSSTKDVDHRSRCEGGRVRAGSCVPEEVSGTGFEPRRPSPGRRGLAQERGINSAVNRHDRFRPAGFDHLEDRVALNAARGGPSPRRPGSQGRSNIPAFVERNSGRLVDPKVLESITVNSFASLLETAGSTGSQELVAVPGFGRRARSSEARGQDRPSQDRGQSLPEAGPSCRPRLPPELRAAHPCTRQQ